MKIADLTVKRYSTARDPRIALVPPDGPGLGLALAEAAAAAALVPE